MTTGCHRVLARARHQLGRRCRVSGWVDDVPMALASIWVNLLGAHHMNPRGLGRATVHRDPHWTDRRRSAGAGIHDVAMLS